jgi:phenylalanyl-tRNA synthetase beta chain
MRRYAGIVPMAPVAPMEPTLPSPSRRLERRLGDVLALELGYVETLSPAFYGPLDARALGLEGAAHVGILHPLTEEQDRLLLTTAGPLLRVAQRNLAREARGRVFEQTRLILPSPARGSLPTEVPVFGLLIWDRSGGDEPPGRLFREGVDDLRRLLGRASPAPVEVADHRGECLAPGLPAPGWLHAGRRAAFRLRGQLVAAAGEVAPAVLRAYALEGRAVHAEIAVSALLVAAAADASPYRPVHRFPLVTFDIAVVVPRRTPAAEVAASIQAAAPGHVREVVAFDEYEGPGIPEGTRSLAFTCELLDPDATVSPERAEALRGEVRRAVESKGWSVRAGEA